VVLKLQLSFGISAEENKQLFDNFNMQRPGVLNLGSGSELGLAYCKQIIELHGGTISSQSKVGPGSIFSFSVPFTVAPTPDVQPLLPGPGPDAWDLNSIKVLVVEDIESMRKMMTMLLHKFGFCSSAVENGKQAVDLVLADPHEYKLVLMDNLMPEMCGRDGAKAMRQASYPYLIIGVTGNVLSEDIQDFLNCGVDMVLAKPFKKATLDKIVQFIQFNGPISKKGMQLVENEGTLQWEPNTATEKVGIKVENPLHFISTILSQEKEKVMH
jgi:CheY-like chemotaxis protein